MSTKIESNAIPITSTSTNEDAKKLYSGFSFWFKVIEETHHNNQTNKDILNTNKQTMNQEDYSEMMKKIYDFNTIEEFWDVYQYLKKPQSSKHGLEISVFKSHIKPMWEDEYNTNGGKVSLKIRKEYSNLIWDEFVYRFIGNLFPIINNDELNGLVFSIKRDSNFIQVWFRSFNMTIVNDITASVKKILNIPDNVELDIRPFNKPKDKESIPLTNPTTTTPTIVNNTSTNIPNL